jgi:hypothetical protein
VQLAPDVVRRRVVVGEPEDALQQVFLRETPEADDLHRHMIPSA